MVSSYAILLISTVAVILVPSTYGDFENLSSSQLEDILKTLEYEEEYRNELDASEPQQPDFLNQYESEQQQQQEEEAEAEAEELLGFAPPKVRQTESLQHGTPFGSNSGSSHSLPKVSAGGPTKANPPPKGAQGGVLPAYCDPPNPCPIGYTDKDGCIEDFENSSEFSRKYQARQNCLCDSEHMFNCPMEEGGNEGPKSGSAAAADDTFLAGYPPALGSELEGQNPYLAGNRLPIAAKKGFGF